MAVNALGWKYDITADGTALLNYCDRVVIVTEGMANREDSNFKVPGLEGEMSFPNKLWDAGNVIMVTFLKYADSDDLVTHADGAAGHVYENFSALKRILGKNGLVDLRRDAPDYGETKMLVELIQGPQEVSYPAHRLWVLKAPKPFWSGLTPVTVNSNGNITPDGDAPIDDMVASFPGNGRITIDDEWIEMSGAGEAAVVDCGERTVVSDDSAEDPLDRHFQPYSDRWLRLEGGVQSSVTVTGSAEFEYFPKWHGGG